MKGIDEENLILESEAFERARIEKKMSEGGFNSIAKFELFLWDLEIFMQLRKKLGDKIILKGGAAVQFYIPITSQRTSIDIDMISTATREELHETISRVEAELNGAGEYCKFIAHKPQNPKLSLDALETYYMKVPSICDERELFTSQGKQEIKIEILFSDQEFPVVRVKKPNLFALDTEREYGIMALEALFADKLTTLGPATIGIPDDRADEQFKQMYDVITLFVSNMEQIISQKEEIKRFYCEAAKRECQIRNIAYEPEQLFRDMMHLIDRVKNIENDNFMLQLANDFQSLYLRRIANRDKAQWAIAGYQLGLLAEYIFYDNDKILSFRGIEGLVEQLKFTEINGPERGRSIKEARIALESKFGIIEGLSEDLFRKRLDRIIWELASVVSFNEIDLM